MGLFIDIRKAFDSVNHNILLYKLYNIGFRGNTYNLLKSYLSERKIFTNVNDKTSALHDIPCGVPQGSVLGPLLFLVYINDMYRCIADHNLKIFADDSNVFVTSDTVIDLFSKSNLILSQLHKWCTSNKLVINLSKSTYMLFKPSRTTIDLINQHNLQVSLYGNALQYSEKFKYLGVWLDSSLSWDTHTTHLTSKLNKLVGIFYRYKYILPFNCRKNLYYALVHSNITYAIEIYGLTTKTNICKLNIACNRILRSLQNGNKTTPINTLYSNFNLLMVNDLHKLNLMKLMYKCIYMPTTLPTHFTQLFQTNSQIHNHNTRGSNSIHLANNCKGNSISFKMSTEWNKLPPNIKTLPSISKFIPALKQYYLESP